jgi:tRNA-splicing ligase RtcB
MRLLRTNLALEEVRPKLPQLLDRLFKYVPAGVGGKGTVPLSKKEFEKVLMQGADWCHANGFASDGDLDSIEQRGRLAPADPAQVSAKAMERGIDQLGTLGSGNHYLEMRWSSRRTYSIRTRQALRIDRPNQIVVMVHCGSRGFRTSSSHRLLADIHQGGTEIRHQDQRS